MKQTMTHVSWKVLWAGLALGLGACASQPVPLNGLDLAGAGNTADVKHSDPYAVKAIAAEDWSSAMSILEALDSEDPLVLLNLAHAYYRAGRSAEAVEIYEQVLEQDANPYANIGARAPLRVKTIATQRLAVLRQGE